MKLAGVLLLAAVLLVGCGQATSEDAMKAKFAKVDYDMASIEEGKTPQVHLERLTRQYITLIHEYEDQLGTAEVKAASGRKRPSSLRIVCRAPRRSMTNGRSTTDLSTISAR